MAASATSAGNKVHGLGTSKTLGSDENSLIIDGKLKHRADKAPFSLTVVHLVAKKRFCEKVIGSGETQMKGSFKFIVSQDYKDYPLSLKVYNPFNKSDPNSELVLTDTILLNTHQPAKLSSDGRAQVINVGTVYSTYLEAQAAGEIGLVEQPSDSSKKVESVNFEFLKGIIGPVIKTKLKELFSACSTTEDIQNTFKRKTRLSVCDSNTIELALNGIPEAVMRETEDGGYVHVINWDRYDKDPEGPNAADMPNVEAYYAKNKDDTLHFQKIALQFPGKDKKEYTSASPEWKRVLYLYNSMMLVYGEAKRHLGFEHLGLGEIARAARRNLSPKNPLMKIYGPQTHGTLPINEAGADDIFGIDGVLGKARFAIKGVDLSLKDVLAGSSWKNYFPGGPISKQHRLAIVKQEVYRNLHTQMQRFVTKNEKKILHYKPEIYEMFMDLARNSPEYRPFEQENDAFGPWAKQQRSEIDQSGTEGRLFHKDKYRAQHPIADSPLPAKDETEFLNNVVQALTYAEFLNFNHSVTHPGQVFSATNLQFASIAPRLGQAESSEPRDEDGYLPIDSCGNTDREPALAQLGITHVLIEAIRPLMIESEITSPFVKQAMADSKSVIDEQGIHFVNYDSLSI